MNPAFDLNVIWAAAAGLVVGGALVFLLVRRGGSANRERAESLARELEETQLELEGHREEVAKHFTQTSDLFRDLTEQYSRLYAHLATGARDFCPDDVPSLGQGLDTPLLVDESPLGSPAEVADPAPDEAPPATSDDAPAKPDAAPAKPDAAPAKPDAARAKPDAAPTGATDAERDTMPAETAEDERAAGSAGAKEAERDTAPAAQREASGEVPSGEEDAARVAVEAPVPGAAPPPVASKPNGGSHLTH